MAALAQDRLKYFSTSSLQLAEWILTKLDRKQVFNVLYQVCVFRADRKSKMAALAFDWLKHFSTSSQPLNGFWRNLLGSKSSTPSIRFVFLVSIGNPRWPSWPLIGWNIFLLLLRNRWMDFDETWQETSLQRPLPSLCFRADRKSKMAALAFDWLKHFSTSSQPLNGFWRNLIGSKSSTPSITFVFFVPIRNPRLPPWPLIGWNIFLLLLRNRWMDFDETW